MSLLSPWCKGGPLHSQVLNNEMEKTEPLTARKDRAPPTARKDRAPRLPEKTEPPTAKSLLFHAPEINRSCVSQQMLLMNGASLHGRESAGEGEDHGKLEGDFHPKPPQPLSSSQTGPHGQVS